MCIVGMINYWLLLPTAVMTFLFYLIRMIYVNAGRSIKRIEALSEYLNKHLYLSKLETNLVLISICFTAQLEVQFIHI